MATLEALTGDAQLPISLGACGKAHLVIVAAKIFQLDVFAVFDVAVKSKRVIAGHSVEHAHDLLDLLVVGGDAVTNQTERSWEALEHIDRYTSFQYLEQALGQIKCGRTRPDDGNSQGLG